MGYFPLPELKGKPNRIFVDGKTLNQIAKESGIRLDTVQLRIINGLCDGIKGETRWQNVNTVELR